MEWFKATWDRSATMGQGSIACRLGWGLVGIPICIIVIIWGVQNQPHILVRLEFR